MPKQKAEAVSAKESPILTTLGRERFTKFVTVKTPGKFVWFNYELARSLGFDIRSANLVSSKVHRGLLDMLSVRALPAGAELDQHESSVLYADKYGGDDLGGCLGAGRAGFLPYLNLYLKGIGHTPLFRHNDPTDFEHSHGGLSMLEGMLEAVFGEANANLFTKGSARILAIIDQGDYTEYPNGKKEARAVVVRAGVQLRPAHLFAKGIKGGYSKLDLFTRITDVTGQLQLRRAGPGLKLVPDIKETMLRIIDDHALTAAEQFRWRIVHGAISLSNMEMSGAMLDATTESAQPRTAPMRVLTQHPDVNLVFGLEHLERARQLQIMYRSLVKTLSNDQRKQLNVDSISFALEMERSYAKHLRVQLLKAAGLPMQLAQAVQNELPEISEEFTRLLIEMAALRNRGRINANKPPLEHISVLDIFNLLQNYPRVYFARRGRTDEAKIRSLLRPLFRGNRYLRAKQENNVRGLAQQFAVVYSELMAACQHLSSLSQRRGTSVAGLIIRRAAYENRPMDRLYRGNLLKQFATLIDTYKSSGKSELISGTIDKIIADSKRNFDNLET
jgi:hypothetical protein